MKRFISLLLLIVSISINAQTNQQSVTTEVAGKYEIIQCPIMRRFTMRIDKESGYTWVLVSDKNEKPCWQLIKKVSHEMDTKTPDKINYMIFMGGIAAKDIYLINVNTGATWQLNKNTENDTIFWNPVKEISAS